MSRSLEEKNKAIDMRKSGHTLDYIAAELHVAKSTLSLWLRGYPLVKNKDEIERIEREKKGKIEGEIKKKRDERNEYINHLAKVENFVDYTGLVMSGGRLMMKVPVDYKGTTYNRGRYIYLHRYIMEKSIGRLLEIDEIVHHKDENPLNNDIKKLELMTKKEHGYHHRINKRVLVELRCEYCGKIFVLTEGKFKSRTKTSITKKLYCSRKCARLNNGFCN